MNDFDNVCKILKEVTVVTEVETKKASDKFTWGQALVVNTKGGSKKCSGCVLLVNEKTTPCSIIGIDIKDPKNTVCGYFVPGTPMEPGSFKTGKYVTANEAGLVVVEGGTKCGNCVRWSKDEDKCGIVEGTLKADNCCCLWLNDKLEKK